MSGHVRTILLAEDNEDDVFFMQRAAKAAGITHPIQVVAHGRPPGGIGPLALRRQLPGRLPVVEIGRAPLGDLVDHEGRCKHGTEWHIPAAQSFRHRDDVRFRIGPVVCRKKPAGPAGSAEHFVVDEKGTIFGANLPDRIHV